MIIEWLDADLNRHEIKLENAVRLKFKESGLGVSSHPDGLIVYGDDRIGMFPNAANSVKIEQL